MNRFFNIKYLSIVLLAFCLLAFTATDSNGRLWKISKNLELFSNVYKELNESYVDEIEPAGLMRTALTAMLKKLDPYTNYITEAQVEQAKLRRFAGGGDIGVKLIEKEDKIYISEVIEALPADKAGLEAGDRIEKIDGRSIANRSLDEIQTFLVGQPDSEVELELFDFDDQVNNTVAIKREAIKPKDITFSKMLNDSVGYVKLSTFLSQGCSAFVTKEIDKLKAGNENFKYLVFDLRGNPGGYLSEAILVSNIFLPMGELIVFTKGRDPEEYNELKNPKEAPYPDIPLVVLTNGQSASASEIVSGTMQDFDRGVVVGQRSYGKGLVQQTKDIGFNSKVKLTTAKYYINSGRCVQAVDYYGDYTDNGATQIPDSLKNEFRTKNGLKVYDNSGVAPDVLIEKDKLSPYTKKLRDEYAVFDYANYFSQQQDSIVSPLEFEVSDAIFDEFVKFTQDNKVQFSFETEKVIDELEKITKEEEYQDVSVDIEQIRKELAEMKKNDIYEHKTELKDLLKYEILNRYYYDDGRLEASLNDDPNIQKAFELFGDMDQYNKILGK